MSKLLIPALALLAALPLATPARAETVTCTPVASLPATLSAQGVYCLGQSLSSNLANGNAITITTNNVTLDCNGHALQGPGAGTLAFGIQAAGRMNLVLRNCIISGFRIGAYLEGSGHVAEDNLLVGNTLVGLAVLGDGSVVRRNRVRDTGGDGLMAPNGIYSTGNVDLLDNSISGVAAAAGSGDSAYGIRTVSNLTGSLQRNRVLGVVADGGALAYGIGNLASGGISVRDNTLAGDGSGVGLSCDANADAVATGNHIIGFGLGFGLEGCTDAGGNQIH